jgi:hydrogenase expression/formation protein HypC
MVHVGFAISRIDEVEAQQTLELLTQMGTLAEELGAE